MSKKLIAVGIIILGILSFVIYRAVTPATVDNAIASIDSGDYSDAIDMLNALAKTSPYDEGEKVYYYRLKALMGLINELNEDYIDECKKIDAAKDKKSHSRITRTLDELNSDLELDLMLQTDPSCHIYVGGKLHNEFTALYPGSRYIETVDFEKLQFMMNIHKTTIDPIIDFYNRYPQTIYLSSIINLLFTAAARPAVELKGHSDTLTILLQNFCNTFSSSAEYYRIFRSNGENVNLRNSADTHGRIVGMLDMGEIVIQLERSMDSMQIGDVRDYWYRVVSVNGSRGWVFGRFLERIEPVRGTIAQNEEIFTIVERYDEWIDSNTPKGWRHLFAGHEGAISFARLNDKNIVRVNAVQKAGLYKKTGSFQNVTYRVKGRLIRGTVILAGVVGYGGFASTLTLMPGAVDVCGFRIPYDTMKWNEYELRTEGKTLSLFINGELVARRINPQKHDVLKATGMYMLVCQEEASAEIEYIKVK